MKAVKRYAVGVTFLFIMTLILAGTSTILKYSVSISDHTLIIVEGITGALIFLLSGIIIGRGYGKKGYLHGLVLVVIYLIALFIITRFNEDFNFWNIIIKSICLLIGSILGVNLKKR